MRNRMMISVAAAMLAALLPLREAHAQKEPVYSVPSPEAAGLGLYGSVPVGLFTGVPDVTVPIHEIVSGGMTFPVTLSYHLASVRPNTYPGHVGLGWSLQCGGCITRTVRGVPDEKKTGSYENGFYGHRSEMSGITDSYFDYLVRTRQDRDGDDWYEVSADEFSFSFFGHSGNFYVSPDGGWTVVSDEDISVEFDESDGFFDHDAMCSRIPGFYHWPNKSSNSRHFKKFTLVTPDGCRYTFGGALATDFSVPYYSRVTGDLVATSWHLSLIETPEGRRVEFGYSADEIMVDIRYSPGALFSSGTLASQTDWLNTGRRGFTGFLLYPARLDSVRADDVTLRFGYDPDLGYSDLYLPSHAGEALYWSESGYLHDSVFGDPSGFTYLFPPISGDSDQERRRSIASSLRADILKYIQIDVQGGDGVTVFLGHSGTSRRKLSRVAWRPGIQDGLTYVMGEGILYYVHLIPDYDGDDMPEYRFTYDPQSMPEGYVLPGTDRWGCWNGSSLSPSSGPGPLSHSEHSTRAETLTCITWPTGGRTFLEYEGHDYSMREDEDHAVVASQGVSGGLRIRRSSSYSRDGGFVSSTLYHYSDILAGQSASSGVARMFPPDTVVYSLPGGGFICMYEPSGHRAPVTNLNSPEVGYSCVTEESVDSRGNPLGYVVSRFSNYGTDINGVTHADLPAYHSCNVGGVSGSVPYTSLSSERGKLLSRSWHKADGTEVRREDHEYARVGGTSVPTATQRTYYVMYDPSYVDRAAVGWLTYTETSSYLPVRTVVREGGFTSETATSYSDSRQVVSTEESGSDGGRRRTFFTYPSDHPQEYGWMTERHILSPVVTTRVESGGMSMTETSTYSPARTWSDVLRAYVSRRQTSWGESGEPRTDYEVVHTDSWGNPEEIVENGRHTYLLWGMDGRKLILRVDDMTREGYMSLGQEPAMSSSGARRSPFLPQDPVPRWADGLHSWKYSYDRNLRLVRAENPDGTVSTFSYDALGRLAEESVLVPDMDGNLTARTVRKHEYHYHAQND